MSEPKLLVSDVYKHRIEISTDIKWLQRMWGWSFTTMRHHIKKGNIASAGKSARRVVEFRKRFVELKAMGKTRWTN